MSMHYNILKVFVKLFFANKITLGMNPATKIIIDSTGQTRIYSDKIYILVFGFIWDFDV